MAGTKVNAHPIIKRHAGVFRINCTNLIILIIVDMRC